MIISEIFDLFYPYQGLLKMIILNNGCNNFLAKISIIVEEVD